MRKRLSVWGGVLLLAGGSLVAAQEPAATPAAGAEQAPKEAEKQAVPPDVATVDGIVKAYYEVVSGPAGAPRQWARDRELYVPGARLVGIHVPEGQSEPQVKMMDHEQFVAESDASMVRDGFYEKEVNRVIRKFGNIAQVFSTYEARQTPEGPVRERGVNSLDLVFDGTRWWIAAALWDVERPGNPIPDSLQPWGLGCPPARPAKKGGKPRARKR